MACGVATETLAFSRSSHCPGHLLRIWKVFCCHCHVNLHSWGHSDPEIQGKRGANQVMLVRQYCLLHLRTSSGELQDSFLNCSLCVNAYKSSAEMSLFRRDV